ncbi:hypothetical protein [Actinomyces sp. oral taxon 171]|nr:hypothetical protein [Actinomyces sp. oral taxon 171]
MVGVEDPLAEEERVVSLIDDWISPQLVPAIDLSRSPTRLFSSSMFL